MQADRQRYECGLVSPEPRQSRQEVGSLWPDRSEPVWKNFIVSAVCTDVKEALASLTSDGGVGELLNDSEAQDWIIPRRPRT